jgi:AcrR family transcriptional regulator
MGPMTQSVSPPSPPAAGRSPVELPVLGAAAPERADAARNRRRILAAADRLFREQGVENVSMDAVAEAAGVGKGTLYRRFGDRSGLALALLDERERELQEHCMRGAPPLGPGAPPDERLVAFLHALFDQLESSGDLLLASERGAPGARHRSSVYGAWHRHVAVLIGLARPDDDANVLAHAVLAPLGADLHMHLRRREGVSPERLRAGLEQLARAVAAPPGSSG